MATRSVIVRLEAEVAGFVAGMGRAGRATDDVARQVVQSRRSIEENSAAMDKAGNDLLIFGAASVTALGASAKAAMDWESAWAGVTKTVNGTPAEMDALEASLRGLAKTLPLTHEEIAGVAEAAGQLGVAREDVAGFTKTMIDLGVSTNLTAEEAATQIAQISNVMGTMAREGSEGVARFGATLVALGNAGASTEAEILSMSQRIAGAAATVGASETDVLALSNTLASMGIKAELGGGVTTRVLLKMYAAVQDGGEKLDAFAKTAGTSSADFAKAFGDSPVKALDMVDKGLARVKAENGNVVASMKDMGIKGTEELQVMLALAASGDLLSDSLALGSKAWTENTALVNEANKRYDTTQSKITIAWNNIKDAAIDAGAVLLPIIQGVAESVTGLAQTFGSLPQPVKSAVTLFVGVVGVAAVLGGSMLKLTTRFAESRASILALNAAGSRLPGTLTAIGKGAGVALAAVIGFEAVKGLSNSLQAPTDSLETFTQALVGLGSNSGALDNLFAKISNSDFEGSISNAGAAMERLVNQKNPMEAMESFGATVLGIDNGMAKLADGFDKTDKAIASAATSGKMDLAAAGFKKVADSAKEHGVSLEEVGKRFPTYLNALRQQASDAGKSVTEQELLNWALGKTPDSMKDAAGGADILKDSLAKTGVELDGVITDMDKFLEQLFATGQITMSARDANAAYNEALRGIPATLKEIADSNGKMGATLLKNGKDFDLSTEAGAKANEAFQNLARKGMDEVTAQAKEGMGQEDLQKKLTTTYEDLVKSADQMGIHGQAAKDLARDVLGVPDGVDIHTWMDDQAKKVAEDTKKAVDAIPKYVSVTIETFKTSFEKRVGLAPTGISDGSAGQGAGVYAPGFLGPKKAGGGDLDMAPGAKGVDSQLFIGAKGEHVLTAPEVDAMGGQQAVYRFRAQIRAGNVRGYAGGGGIGTIGAVASSQSLRAAAGGGGTHFDFSGATFTALDPAGLRREVVADITYELNKKSGVRIV
jgi:TP901 family phage tail tape measure protein